MTTETHEAVQTLPVLPIKNTVLFPYLFLPLSVGRPNSVAAVEAALATEEKTLFVVAQRNADSDQPGADDLYPIGTKAVIKKMARSDSAVEVLVQGTDRMAVLKVEQAEPYLKARVRTLPLPDDGGTEIEALYRAVLEQASKVLELAQPQNQINIAQLAAQAQDPLRLAYLLGSML